MNRIKYVIALSGYFGTTENAIILDSVISHDEIGIDPDKIVSAGFFSWSIEKDSCGNQRIKVNAFGKSVSLGKESREEDSFLIERALNYL